MACATWAAVAGLGHAMSCAPAGTSNSYQLTAHVTKSVVELREGHSTLSVGVVVTDVGMAGHHCARLVEVGGAGSDPGPESQGPSPTPAQ